MNLFIENRCHVRAGRGAATEDEGVPAAEPDGESKDGGGQGHQQAERSSESFDLPPT